MKKNFTTIILLFSSIFTALSQSVTLMPNTQNQVSVRGYGVQRPTFSGYSSQGNFSTPGAAGTARLLIGLYGYGYTGSSFTTEPNAAIELRSSNSYTPTSTGSTITFQTTADGSTTLLERMRITDIGNIGIGTSLPNGNLSFSNSNNSRKIVLYEDANNDHQFLGFGVNSQILRYQIPSTNYNHIFYAGASTTTSNELMRITGTGNVGIGTNNPISKLHVNTSSNEYGITHSDGIVTLSSFVNGAGAWLGTTSNHPLSFYVNAGGASLQINTSGNTSIGRLATHQYKLEVHPTTQNGIGLYNSNDTHRWEFYVEPNATGINGGDLALWVDGNQKGFFDRISGIYTIGSDRKLKKNISALDDVLDKVIRLKPCKYQYISNNPNGVESIGFIAQEVEPLFPQFVGTAIGKEGEETKTMDYSGMSVIAIKAIQEQQELILELQGIFEKLQNENATMKSENKAIERRLSKIEKMIAKKDETKN